MSVSRPSRSEWMGLFLHPFFIALGCAISFGLLLTFNVTMNLPQHRYDDTASIFNPAWWLPSFFIGLIINRFARHRWAGFVPVIAGTLAMITIVVSGAEGARHSAYEMAAAHGHVWRYELGLLFAPVSSVSPQKSERVLGQLFFTFPFLSSAAYSIGAWLAIRFGERECLSAANAIKRQ